MCANLKTHCFAYNTFFFTQEPSSPEVFRLGSLLRREVLWICVIPKETFTEEMLSFPKTSFNVRRINAFSLFLSPMCDKKEPRIFKTKTKQNKKTKNLYSIHSQMLQNLGKGKLVQGAEH